MRSRLQSKGTLSANHCISKTIVKFAIENGVSVIGLEDLIRIRDRINSDLGRNINLLKIAGLFTNYNNSLNIKQRVLE
jgi:hypothetical protein